MNWEYVKMILAALLPILYNAILAKNPDLPIDLDTFTKTILYVLFGAIGGWQVLRLTIKSKLKKTSKSDVLKSLKLSE